MWWYFLVPGPTPYGTAAASVAATPYPTTATWNTASQPKTVPTVVPGSPQTTAGSGSSTAGGSPPATTTAQTTAPSPTSAGTAALYGQCGGVSFGLILTVFNLAHMFLYLDWMDVSDIP